MRTHFLFKRIRRPETDDIDWKRTFAQTPQLVRMPVRRQGEAICFDREQDVVWLTSEKRPTPLLFVALPEIE